MKTAHMRHATAPDATLCGEPFEDWQQPVPTDDEIGLNDLPYGVAVLVRQADEQRRLPPGTAVRQCQACFHITRGDHRG